ncbi:Obg-like ATPase 1 [Astathelohania contejeani]|uniref:Obg-like ATPase 1 n=1 Tax=Astathelohania contejeani TaxID=164912 RepID=A0ABQ7HYI1_9MICR|nr:Obg-like ATPase 1 [Thelohania contejeani]
MSLHFSRAGKSHNLSMGIVGLPNVGKSSLFNALTSNNVPAENYPFCTIDPTEGRIQIDDERIDLLVELYKPKNVVKAYLSVIDIAGLVKGASTGLGLGNNFLEHIKRVDAIFHVVRCFEDQDIGHCEQDINPLRDIEIINDELRLKDLEFVTKRIEAVRRSDPKALACLEKIKKLLDATGSIKIPHSADEFTQDEIVYINTLNLLTCKNIVYLANVSASNYKERKVNKHLKSILSYKPIPFNPDLIDATFIKKIVTAGYQSLNLINFFTAGADEVKSWTVRKGSKAPQAAGVIHSDFEKYFIMADVMKFSDLKELGSEREVKKNGKYLQRGKTYVVEDGDIILFKANPPRKK